MDQTIEIKEEEKEEEEDKKKKKKKNGLSLEKKEKISAQARITVRSISYKL